MTAPAVSLPKAVAQTRQQLLNHLKEADPEAAKEIEEQRSKRSNRPTVVVVGETNRGKSSLVNALIGQEGLSPVDAEVATATYLTFGHAEQWHAKACYPGQFAPIPIELSQLVNWVSAAHELPEGQIPPRYVEIEGPSSLLEKLSVVDTPGVGGLDSMHGELAIEAAASATALLFVVDSSAPFTSGELKFLSEVGERVETVIFALSKTDAYRGWRQVLDANLALLAEHAPRFTDAKFHPVSSRMYAMAAKAPNPDAAGMLREKSGIEELRTEMEGLLVGRSVMLGEANTLRSLSSALDAVVVKFEAEKRALSTGAAEVEKLKERKEELTAKRKESTKGWQVTMRSEIQRTRLEITHEVSRQVRDMQSWFRQQIDASDRDKLATLPQEVDHALQLISHKVANQLSNRLNQVAQKSLSELFSTDELTVLSAQIARAENPPVVLRPPEKRQTTSDDKLMVIMGGSSGFGLARGAASMIPGMAGVAAAGFVMLPVAVVGLGLGWWMGRTRKFQAEKTHMKQWLGDAIADARSTLDQLVAEQMIEADSQLSLAMDEALRNRISEIEDELKEVDKAMRLDATERSKRLTAVSKKLTDVTSGRERAQALLARIRSVRDRNA
ncbi:dynamin family protein [Labedaea rhizosphaerae]|uniref:Dynamin family protein n=1 Tax=Labedaea rhizosphaerae TaxID=598644 RepID=A0A4R6SNS8_LABRH|nr:dynamin family protein [Labedaea rhizosphaerae]TDQ05250.1 dynamin family protein [Labedaea rhizosphaerae]